MIGTIDSLNADPPADNREFTKKPAAKAKPEDILGRWGEEGSGGGGRALG